MKRFRTWLAGVWSATKFDEKKGARYLTALGAILVTAAYQVFDVGVDAIVAMDPKQLVKRCVVCLAFGVIGALAHGGPFKPFTVEVEPSAEPKPDPAALLAAVALAQGSAPTTTSTPHPASGSPSAT